MHSVSTGISAHRNSPGERRRLASRVREYAFEITDLLDSVPRSLVLVLKTNDLLRHTQRKLGLDESLCLLPIANRCSEIIYKRRMSDATGITSRLAAVFRLLLTQARLGLAEWAVWKIVFTFPEAGKFEFDGDVSSDSNDTESVCTDSSISADSSSDNNIKYSDGSDDGGTIQESLIRLICRFLL